MTKSKYHNSKSFLFKTRIAFLLLGIFPFLIVIYLFCYGNLDVTDTIVLFAALALFSILTGFVILRHSSDQLINLSKKIDIAKVGESNGPIKIKADQELIDIAENFNAILDKLNGVDREIKEQSIQLVKYASDLSKSYEKSKKEEKLRTKLSRYVDIRSFTRIAERMEVEDVVSMLNEFFGTMVDIIFKNNGILDKFLGDQLMAVFEPILSENTAPYDAVKSAIEMQEAIEALMKVRGKQKKETFEIGIGINTGNSIVGNVGAENRMDYTVIGDSVNVAARLQQLAKGGEIIIGEQTYRQVKDRFRIEKKGELPVKNKNKLILCYSVLK